MMTLFPHFHSFRRVAVFALLAATLAAEGVQVSIDLASGHRPVSSYLYGKNEGVGHPNSPLTEAGFQFLRDSGVTLLRMHGGNNGTKYNWKKRLTSHPDWYNNVYESADWDYSQTKLQEKLPGVQSMWCFGMLGKVAANTRNNFNDWDYNRSQYWSGVNQNLAGGGVPGAAGGKALKAGDPALYLEDSSSETVTAILDHWIRPEGLGLDRGQFLYWNMDNEPEIWEGTHDDVMPRQLPAEQFMQRYFEYAKRARARFPEIKLVGPVPANEWQWFNWPGGIVADGRSYPWLEYFIKRVGEEQARTGIRLLDVLDIHYYPGASNPADVVQLHRVFFDRSYSNPEAHGVKNVNGARDESITQEYVFGRCQEWLDRYCGAGHGVTFSVSETGAPVQNAPLASVWYASLLGEFMRQGVEILTPWSWQPGMWEVLHLFARYNGSLLVHGLSDNEQTLSAYPTVDPATGRLTVLLVNRALASSTQAVVTVANSLLPDGDYDTLQLSELPSTETFVSHDTNALKPGSVRLVGGRLSLTLPPLSITSVLLPGATPPAEAPGASRLANLSVRAKSGSGDAALIVGFVLSGTGNKDLLLRGVGPGLERFGISSPLANPVMQLTTQAGAPLAENNDWATAGEALAQIADSLGAFSLEKNSLDAALFAPLAEGGYTARIDDKTGRGGIVLGEAYDASHWKGPRLSNLSARTWVGEGMDGLVAGFVVSGGVSKTLLIRAVGPELERYHVSGVLQNPQLRVYRQGESIPLAYNDDWGTISYEESLRNTAERVGAFPLTSKSRDAVLLLTLPPGVYTAVVSPSASTTGVALVEVYEVPAR